MNNEMWCVITSPESDVVLDQYQLCDNDPLDPDVYAKRYAKQVGYEIDVSDGHIPNCCGDFRVELMPDPWNPVHIYNGKSYYWANE